MLCGLQASAAALSGTVIPVRRQDWVSSSSSRRLWGGNAGPGATALFEAAAEASAGPGIGDAGYGSSKTGSGIKTGRGWNGRVGAGRGGEGPGGTGARNRGLAMDVRPNQVGIVENN